MNRTPLFKPKYNDDELRKAVDTNVVELIKSKRVLKPDTTPGELYRELLEDERLINEEIKKVIKNIEVKNLIITDLSNTIEEINKKVDYVKVEENIETNKVETTQNRFIKLNLDFTQALQRAIQEEIDMTSLQSQNDGLRAEFNTLKEIENSLQGLLQQTDRRVEEQELLAGSIQRDAEQTQSIVAQINHQIQTFQNQVTQAIQQLINR